MVKTDDKEKGILYNTFSLYLQLLFESSKTFKVIVDSFILRVLCLRAGLVLKGT